jgi:hypothetical protein
VVNNLLLAVAAAFGVADPDAEGTEHPVSDATPAAPARCLSRGARPEDEGRLVNPRQIVR